MEHQGYGVNRNIFYQDNESAIKMERNGLKSCGDRSRHINIRYFFIKDILKNELIDLKHCRTENMVADFLTKPLQGKQFKRFRDMIMGITCFPVEEHVENYRKVATVKKDDKQRRTVKWSEVVKNSDFCDVRKPES